MRKSNSFLNDLADSENQASDRLPDENAAAHHTSSNNAGFSPHPSADEGPQVKAAFEAFTKLLDSTAQLQTRMMQEPIRNPEASEENLTTHIQTLANSITDLKTMIIDGQTNGTSNDDIRELKTNFEQLREEIQSQPKNTSDNPETPESYAQIVEKSHSDILSQIREIQSSVELNATDPELFINAIQERQSEVLARIDTINEALHNNSSCAVPDELNTIREQIGKLDSGLKELAENLNSQTGTADFRERLDEITRGILALSGSNTNVDNLERIEARIIDFSKELNSTSGAKSGDESNDQFDPSLLEPYFTQTLSALNACEDRLSRIERNAKDSANDHAPELANNTAPMARQSNKSAALPEPAGIEGSDMADQKLLRRLDALVSAVESLENQNSGIETLSSDVMSLETQISALLEKFDNISALRADTRLTSAVEDDDGELLSKLEVLADRIDALSDAQHNQANTEEFASMQQQLSIIAANIHHDDTEGREISVIEERLDSIEKQLCANRDIGIEVAVGAAEEAIRRVLAEMPASQGEVGQSELAGLLGDIHNIITADKNQTDNTENLTLILDEIAERIGTIEARARETYNEPSTPPSPVLQQQDQDSDKPVAEHIAFPHSERVETPHLAATPAMEKQTPPLDKAQSPQVTQHTQQARPKTSPENHAPTQQLIEERTAKRAMSAGELLVRAARQAEHERQKIKIGYEEKFANSRGNTDPGQLDADFSDETIEPDGFKIGTIPDIETPELSKNATTKMHGEATAPLQQASNSRVAEKEVAIAPGSSRPDLAALVKQANDRRKTLSDKAEGSSGTDFLAAARRAAQAAALEASQDEEPEITENKPQGLMSSIPKLLSRSKKLVLVGSVAILLSALTASVLPNFSDFPNNEFKTKFAALVVDENTVDTTIITEDIPTSPAAPVETIQEEVRVPGDARQHAPELPITEIVENKPDTPETPETPDTPETPPFSPWFDSKLIAFAPDTLREAALNNDPIAFFEIARRFTEGIGTPKDLGEAARWYEKAASMGIVPAQYVIGNFHHKGIGVSVDRTIARVWYEQAASSGNILSMHNLGVMSTIPDPETGQADYANAIKWFRKAAQYDVRDSQVNLGIFLAKGKGTDIDLIESYKWLAIAAKTGDADAQQKRDIVAKALSSNQLETAKKKIKSWAPTPPSKDANDISIPLKWTKEPIAILDDPQSIAKAQTLLSKIGFDVGPADGIIGNKTKDAVQSFRSHTGLPINQQIDSELIDALLAVAI